MTPTDATTGRAATTWRKHDGVVGRAGAAALMWHVAPPGDKSISHRALLFGAMAGGPVRIRGLSTAADVESTAAALRALGAGIPALDSTELTLAGDSEWRTAEAPIDCANSGTTVRLLTGLLVGLGLGAELDGDASLRRRPMDRVVYPLQAMGGRIRYEGSPDRLPIVVEARASGALRTLRHRQRVASAQVKSALLLAGVMSRTPVEVIEPYRSRDHTERMLEAMGVPINARSLDPGNEVRFDPKGWDGRFEIDEIRVPGDPSSAAFLIGAALLRGRPVRAAGISLNPTRTGFLDALMRMGAGVETSAGGCSAGEPSGDVIVSPGRLRGIRIAAAEIPAMLDEIPALAGVAVRAAGHTRIEGAGELRVKESDRLAVIAANLRRLGVECSEGPGTLEIEGTSRALEGRVITHGDHRIAMAFAMLGSAPETRIELDDPECVSVSFPDFFQAIAGVAS